jgi:hypothetical protein
VPRFAQTTGFFCTGICFYQVSNNFFCAAALPEASSTELAAQVTSLKVKPRWAVCFSFPLFSFA